MVNEVTIRPWVKRGIMMVNAEALDFDDPDHIYNQIKSQGGVPEEFGYEHPLAEQFKDKNRQELISQIIELQLENFAMHRDYATHGRP